MKRIYNFMLVAIMAIFLFGCNGSGSLTTKSNKIQGPLGEYFEVVSRNYKVKDGKVSIEIKRIKEGFPSPWTKGMEVGYSDCSFEPHFSIEFFDEDGNVVSKDKTDIVADKDELIAVANLGVDESSTVTFLCLESAAQFKISSTFKFHGEEEQTVNMDGSIGKYPIVMTMHIAADGEVTGAYYYKSKGPGNYLYLKGEKNDDHITLNEFTKNGQQTGTYDGTYNNGIYKGHFNTKSGYYQFVLKPTNAGNIDLSNIDFDSFNAEYIINDDSSSDVDNDFDVDTDGNSYESTSSDSEDWDALLDSYEQFVDKYIRYVKKAAKGDMTALAEYPSLMQKTQEFSDRLQTAQGDMSASQWARYLRITNKMTKAAQELK